MRVDVTTQLKELDGTMMITGKRACVTCGQVVGNMEPMTVCLAATRALAFAHRDEQDLPGDKKVERWHLALKLIDAGEPDLSVEELTLIKKLVGKMYGPVVVGQVWAILDPPGKE